MARFACADWIGPTVNEGDGDGVPLESEDSMGTVIWAVLHIQEGTEAGTESWQRNPDSDVSSHFLLPKIGRRPRQMVDTRDRSWCQVRGNRGGISMECEGWPGDALTDDQLYQAAQIMAEAHTVHGLALRICDDPTATTQAAGGLIYHAAGGDAWGGHFDCPGPAIIAQRPAILAGANQILNGDDMIRDDRDAWIESARVEAFTHGLPKVRYSDVEGEPVWLVQQIQFLTAAAAASAQRENALAAAFQALTAGGTSVDTAAVLARISQVAEVETAAVAGLTAQLDAARAEIARLTAVERAEAQAAANALDAPSA